jgi:hypothetical protein
MINDNPVLRTPEVRKACSGNALKGNFDPL